MTKASATYEGDDLKIVFSADYEKHPEGDVVTNIEVELIEILGVPCDWSEMQEYDELAAAVLAKADDLEFEPIDSSEADDIDD